MRLGIDLDGVVADFNGGWMRFYNHQFGTRLTPSLVDSWDVIPRITHFDDMGEFWAWAADLDGASLFRHLEPFPGAVDAMLRLDTDHQIVVITAKPDFAHTDTHEWLVEHGVPHDEVHITETKHEVAADIYLDDGPHVLESLVAHRPTATVCRYVRPWNDPLSGAIDVTDWGEFERLVLAKSNDATR